MTKDPVCGMAVDTAGDGIGWVTKAVTTVTHDGKTYSFCSDACKAKFLADPGRYAEKREAGAS